jgi:hypothetical protein
MPRDTDGYGKTDDPRPCLVSRSEVDLRWALAFDKSLTETQRGIFAQCIAKLVEARKHGNSQ